MLLEGNSNGSIDVAAEWSQIGGPAAIISDPSDLNSAVLGYVPNVTYSFRITATCEDGAVVSDDVDYTVSPVTISNAGESVESCPGELITLNANSAGGDETGVWTIESDDNAGVDAFSDENLPNATFTLPDDQVGTSTLRWTIEHSNGCESFSEILITNFGGLEPVDAGDAQTLASCYTVSTETDLVGSVSGNGTGGQQGTWTLVSGPNYPVFSDINDPNCNISGLIEGTYVFRWTVTGACANGVDEVTITVGAAIQGITDADAGDDIRFCNANTSAFLEANVPAYSNETGTWTKVSGPDPVVITNPNSPTTSVTGLNGSSTYTFRYTIDNTNSNCSTEDDVKVRYYSATTSITLDDDAQVLDCGDNKATITYSYNGGSASKYKIIAGPYTTTSWSSGGNGSKTVTFNDYGTFTVLFRRIAYGFECADAFDQIDITVSESPSASNAGTDQILACNVIETDLAGNDPDNGAGEWMQISGPNTAVIADPLYRSSHISGLIEGAYLFTWVISGGALCPPEADNVIVYVNTPTTSTSAAGANQLICGESVIYLNAAAPQDNETGTWSVVPNAGLTFSDINDPNATLTGVATNSSYEVTWSVSNPCASDANSLTITTTGDVGPSAANAGPDQCMPDGTVVVTMEGNTPDVGEGTWNILSGPNTPSIDNPNNPSTTITGLVDGIYEIEWAITNVSCNTNTDVCYVIINSEASTAEVGDDLVICGNLSTLSATTPANGIGTWYVTAGTPGYSFSDVNSPTSTFSDLSVGTYYLTWEVQRGTCPATTDDLVVNVSYNPTTADAGVPQTICGATSVTLTAIAPTDEDGFWSFVGDPLNTPTIVSPNDVSTNVTGLVTGEYTFRWNVVSGAGCNPSTDDVVIQVSAPANAGPSEDHLCNSSEVLLVGTEGTDGVWSEQTAHGGVTFVDIATYSVIAQGLQPDLMYTFRYTVPEIYGCGATDNDIDIYTSDFGTAAVAGDDQFVCLNVGTETVILEGNEPSSGAGTWNLLEGPNSPTFVATQFDSEVSNLVEGVYVFEWNIEHSDCIDYSDVVRIEVYNNPSDAEAGDNQTDACLFTTELIGNIPTIGIGTWSLSSGPGTIDIDNPNLPTTAVSNPSLAGVYEFLWTISTGGGCADKSDNVFITFSSAGTPTTPLAGNDIEQCGNTDISMLGNATSVGLGTWRQISGPNTSNIISENSETSTIGGLTYGTYEFEWEIIEGACSLTDNVLVEISEDVTAEAGDVQTFCEFLPLTLAATDPQPGTGVWSMTSGPNTPLILDENAYNTQVAGLIVGTYVFNWEIQNGVCVANSDVVTINIIARPNENLSVSNSADICLTNDTEITVTNSDLDVTYSAYVGSDLVGSAVGTGSDLPIAIDGQYFVLGTNTIVVKADNTTCDVVELLDQATVEVSQGANISQTVSGNSVCENVDGTVTVTAAENTIVYTAYLSGTSTVVGSGTGADANLDITITNTELVIGANLIDIKANNGVCEVQLTNKATVTVDIPVIDKAVTGSFVCETYSTTVTIVDTEVGAVYNAFIGATPVGSVTGDGNDLPITIAADKIVLGANIVRFEVTEGTCSSDLDNQATVTVYDNPTTSLTVVGNTICDTYSSTVTVQASENGILYKAYIGTTEVGSATGNNGDLPIPIAANHLPIGVHTIKVVATLGTCATDLDNQVTITVNLSPITDLTVAGSTICTVDNGTVTITSSENGVTYNAYISTNLVGTIVGDGNDIDIEILASNLAVGDNIVNLVADNGNCELDLQNQATITVTYSLLANLTVAGTTTICETYSSTVTIENSEDGVLYEAFIETVSVGTATGDGNDLPIIVVADKLSVGANVVNIVAGTGVCAVDLDNQVTITVNLSPMTDLTVAGGTICVVDNGTVTITSSENGVTYNAYISTNLVGTIVGDGNDIDIEILASNLAVGDNIVKLVADNGNCELDLQNQANIYVNDAPLTDLSVSNGGICEGGDGVATILSAQNGITYEAYIGTTLLTTEIGNGTDLEILIPASNLTIGNNIINYIANIGTCSTELDNTSTITVYASPDITLDIQANDVCSGGDGDGVCAILSSELGVVYNVYVNQVQVTEKTGTGDNLDIIIAESDLSSNENTIEVYATNGVCVDIQLDNSTIINLITTLLTDISTEGSTIIQGEDGTITLLETEDLLEYEIVMLVGDSSIVVGSATGTGEELTIEVLSDKLDAGDNNFEVHVNNGGCKSIVAYEIIIVIPKVIVPEGFSPNGDGIYDVLIIPGIEEYPTNKVRIFNRWGNPVYEMSPYNNDINAWDGTSNLGISVGGSDLAEGTFFYIIDLDDGSKAIKGFIYLKR